MAPRAISRRMGPADGSRRQRRRRAGGRPLPRPGLLVAVREPRMTGRHWYAPDPLLPHLDVVLDETALARHLAGVLPLPGNPVASVRRVRAKYLPGTSLRVVCSVRAADDVRLVSGRMFPGDISDRHAASAL